MDDRSGVDFRDSQQDALAEFLPGLHPDVPKKGTGHLAKEGFHDIKPRSMPRCQHILETVGAGSKEGWDLFGDVRRMIVQNDSINNGAAGRVVLVEILEQSDEFPAAMPPLNTSCDMTLVQIQRREDRTRPKAFVSMIAPHIGMSSGNRGQIGHSVGDGLKAGLFID